MNRRSLSMLFLGFLSASTGGFLEQAQVWVESELAIPGEAGNLAKESDPCEPPDEIVRCRWSTVEPLPDCGDGYQWVVEEFIHDAVSIAGGSTQFLRDDAAVLFPHLQDCRRRSRRFLAHFGNPFQEECQPAFPVPFVTHGLETFVVLTPVTFEEIGEVQHGLSL